MKKLTKLEQAVAQKRAGVSQKAPKTDYALGIVKGVQYASTEEAINEASIQYVLRDLKVSGADISSIDLQAELSAKRAVIENSIAVRGRLATAEEQMRAMLAGGA